MLTALGRGHKSILAVICALFVGCGNDGSTSDDQTPAVGFIDEESAAFDGVGLGATSREIVARFGRPAPSSTEDGIVSWEWISRKPASRGSSLRPLVEPQLASLTGVTPTRIRKEFLPEMAAMWESLVPEEHPNISDAERAKFSGAFMEHRWIYGYTLLSELPDLLRRALEEHDDLEGLHYAALVIDEYQDLNACDLRVFRLLADRGVAIIGIGDDDQSIYLRARPF